MPSIWMGMDQQALNKAYDQSQYAPNMKEVLARYASKSEALRNRIGQPTRCSYGNHPIETIDLFTSLKPDAATEIFIHGGAWRGGAAKNYAFLADATRAAGVNLIIVEFSSVTESPLGLLSMVNQVDRAIQWIYQHAAELGIDRDKLYLTGHSSGAHLAASVVSTRNTPVQAVVLCSGVYELEPVSLSSRNEYLNLNAEVIQSLSPERHATAINIPITVVHGALESPEFIRQAYSFANAIEGSNKMVRQIEIAHTNHFEILECTELWWLKH
jgi:arylformamidase